MKRLRDQIMKIVQTGKFNAKALETLIELEQPLDRAKRVTLNRLGHLLGFVEDVGTEILTTYIRKLTQHYQNQLVKDFIELKSIRLADFVAGQRSLAENFGLTNSIVNYYFQMLELPEDEDWQNGNFKLPQRNVLRSVLVPACCNLQILMEIIGREEAIKLYKKFMTQYTKTRQGSGNEFESVEDVMKSRLKADAKPSEWVMRHAIIDDGKYAYMNENCLWVDALVDLFDSEIKYYVCCYGDFQGAKSWNKHFILTMENAIAQGDPYCSRLVHDTRVDWNLKHPNRKFWDDMMS